ncbi:MAG: hypothetical protein ACK40E_05140 [Caldimicrobium sp.]
MSTAQVVVETKNITTLSLHPHHILKVLRENAIRKSMSVVKPAGMVVMITPMIKDRAWDTVLIKYVQGRSVNEF